MRVTPGELQLELKSGATALEVDRIVARLGAKPPRDFLSGLGVTFHGESGDAPPVVDQNYQTNTPGIYVIGSLCGFPLIKHAVNQGYEVVDFIKGIETPYADQSLLEETLAILIQDQPLSDILSGIRDALPLLSELNDLQLREFLLDVVVHDIPKGQFVFKHEDYGDSVYLIYRGAATGVREVDGVQVDFNYPEGDYFGEIGMNAGRRRIFSVMASGERNHFIELPRSACLKWCASVRSIQEKIERSSIARELRAYLSVEFSVTDFERLLDEIDLRVFKAGDFLYQIDDEPDGIYLIRKGSVTISREENGREMVISYVPAGNYLGETSLLGGSKRSSNVRAAVECRTIFVPAETFSWLVETQPDFRRRNERKILDQISQNEAKSASAISVDQIVSHGLGEATDMLLVDENLCIRCYNCERACASTHGGTSRLDLDAGTTMGVVRIPTSCRHCEHPHCMSDCPTDAVRRSPTGEVVIDDNCIGCGNCVQNCPYGVIRLEDAQRSKGSALQRFLIRIGIADTDQPAGQRQKQLAVKCDMCAEIPTGPACVNACPTGAAARATPETAFELVDAR